MKLIIAAAALALSTPAAASTLLASGVVAPGPGWGGLHVEFDGPTEGFTQTFALTYSGFTFFDGFTTFDYLLNRILPGGSNDGLDLHKGCYGFQDGPGSCAFTMGLYDGFPRVSIVETWSSGLITFEITNPVGYRDPGCMDQNSCVNEWFFSGGHVTMGAILVPDEQGGYYELTASDPVAVPEPSTWALMIAGFSLAGIQTRRRAALRKIRLNPRARG